MILVIGEILFDVFENYERIGGAPFNFAFHLKKLGYPVRFLTRIGDDTYGKKILDLLKEHDVNTEDVQIDNRHPTGTVQVTLNDQGVPQFDIHTDVAYDYLDANAFRSVLWPDVKMIYIGTLSQRTQHNFTQIQSFIRQKPIRTDVFYDINLRPPHVNTAAVEASLEQTDILKLNEDELSILQSLYNSPGIDDQQVLWMIKQFDHKMVILTKGSRGSVIYTPQTTAKAPVRKSIPIVDTVGAGDAYAAIAAAGYLNGLSPEVIIEKASDFAGYICTLQGAIPEDASIYESMRPQFGGKIDA